MNDAETILKETAAFAKRVALKYNFQNSEQVNERSINMVISQLDWKIQDLKEALAKKDE